MNFAGVHTPFNNVDLIVVRENTEDLYSGIEHEIAPGVVESIKVITRARRGESRSSRSNMRGPIGANRSQRFTKPIS